MTKAQLIAAILDAIGAILGIWIGTLVDEATAQMIVATWVALQVPLLGILGLISYDNKAKLEAEIRRAELEIRRAELQASISVYTAAATTKS